MHTHRCTHTDAPTTYTHTHIFQPTNWRIPQRSLFLSFDHTKLGFEEKINVSTTISPPVNDLQVTRAQECLETVVNVTNSTLNKLNPESNRGIKE